MSGYLAGLVAAHRSPAAVRPRPLGRYEGPAPARGEPGLGFGIEDIERAGEPHLDGPAPAPSSPRRQPAQEDPLAVVVSPVAPTASTALLSSSPVPPPGASTNVPAAPPPEPSLHPGRAPSRRDVGPAPAPRATEPAGVTVPTRRLAAPAAVEVNVRPPADLAPALVAPRPSAGVRRAREPRPPAAGTRSSPAPAGAVAPEPVVHVTIGRIEIRATTPAPEARAPSRARGVMSLDDYMAQRGTGR